LPAVSCPALCASAAPGKARGSTTTRIHVFVIFISSPTPTLVLSVPRAACRDTPAHGSAAAAGSTARSRAVCLGNPAQEPSGRRSVTLEDFDASDAGTFRSSRVPGRQYSIRLSFVAGLPSGFFRAAVGRVGPDVHRDPPCNQASALPEVNNQVWRLPGACLPVGRVGRSPEPRNRKEQSGTAILISLKTRYLLPSFQFFLWICRSIAVFTVGDSSIWHSYGSPPYRCDKGF